jgi:hypothetical protein
LNLKFTQLAYDLRLLQGIWEPFSSVLFIDHAASGRTVGAVYNHLLRGLLNDAP